MYVLPQDLMTALFLEWYFMVYGYPLFVRDSSKENMYVFVWLKMF